MKSASLFAYVVMAIAAAFPAHADTPAETVLLMVFGLDPHENSPYLQRQSPTSNRWRVYTPVDPMKFLFGKRRPDDVSNFFGADSKTATGQESDWWSDLKRRAGVEGKASTELEDLKKLLAASDTSTQLYVDISQVGAGGEGNMCTYKVKLFNENGIVTGVYDFDFSHLSAYDVNVQSAGANPASAKVLTMSGAELVKVSQIDLNDGSIGHLSGNDWQYSLSADASDQRLRQANSDFKSQICHGQQ